MSDGNDFNQRNIAEFRANHGRVSGPFEGAPIVPLPSVGARSGKPRTNIKMYLADGERYLVFASNAGADDNPAWYWNLKANRDARIEVGDDVVDVHATELQGAERDDKYALQAERYPGFAEYQRMTSRTIPVVARTPTDLSQESSGSQHIDFDALYRRERLGEGIAPMTTSFFNNTATTESVIA